MHIDMELGLHKPEPSTARYFGFVDDEEEDEEEDEEDDDDDENEG